MMPDNENFVVQEYMTSKTITMTVKGNNVTLKFSLERNNSVSNIIKKILLESYIKRKVQD